MALASPSRSITSFRPPARISRSRLESSTRDAHVPILSPIVQAKLRIGAPDDAFEHEADRVADRVMRMPQPLVATHGQEEPPATHASVSSLVSGALRSTGEPLAPAVRATMEPHFGRDFGDVRVHTNATAAQSARGLNARAYTLGQDIVFGEGGYAPRTTEGRKLLAHELAHVVQQRSGRVVPAIQRSLIVTGCNRDIRDFIGLLESASGLSLKYDAKSQTVSITASVLKPPSSVLALRLWTIIDDQTRDARIHLGRDQPGVSVGKFPSDLSAKNLVQEVRIDQVLALEKGVPGYGVVKLAHEITENYEGQIHRNDSWNDAFSASHDEGVATENLVARELIGPGMRRNEFGVVMGKGAGRFSRGIADVENYFIVSDSTLGTGIVSNVRKVPRVRVAQFRIAGFDPEGRTLSKGADATLNAVVDEMKKEPTASALLEAHAEVGDHQRINAARMADLVQNEIVDRTGDVILTNWRRFHTELLDSRSGNFVVITLDRPNI